MSLRSIILFAVLGLPYGYLLVRWSAVLAGATPADGHLVFYTLAGLVALPFVMAMVGGTLALGGARRVMGAASFGNTGPEALGEVARGGLRYWIGLSLLLAALPACAALLILAFDTPEEGRDRLGRICERDGGAITCRPDPEADRPSEIDMLNAAMKRQRAAKGN